MKVIVWLVIPCLFISIGLFITMEGLNYFSIYVKNIKQETKSSPLTSETFPPDLEIDSSEKHPEMQQETEDPFPKPTIFIEEEYYKVDGNTGKELYRNIFSVSPNKTEGKTYAGRAHWSVTWNYSWKETPELCTISKVKTSVKVKYILPSWSRAHGNSRALGRKWKTYSTALRRHEEGHAEFAIKAANKIVNALKEMGPRYSCSELKHAANWIGEEILNRFKGLNHQYDIDTNHGKTQGATWN